MGVRVLQAEIAIEPIDSSHLEGLTIPCLDRISEVRIYVASVLRAAKLSRGSFGAHDPEVDHLVLVGEDNVPVLLEALEHAELGAERVYLVEAIRRLARPRHRDEILRLLSRVPDLIEVVLAHGWTPEAAPQLLRELERRSVHMHPRWVVAAAGVSTRLHFDALRFQLIHGQLPVDAWLAMRELPAMEPLDELVLGAWGARSEEALSDEPWTTRRDQLAVIASHYGSLTALAVFAKYVDRTGDWRALFTGLTGASDLGVSGWQPGAASAWLAKNRTRLVFDRGSQRFRRR